MTAMRIEAVLSFIRAMGTAIANTILYTVEHPQVNHLCSTALEQLSALLNDTPELSILVIDGEFVVEGTPLGTAFYLNRFAQSLSAHGMGNIMFRQGISLDELKKLIDILAHKPDPSVEIQAGEHIRFGKVEIGFSSDPNSDGRGMRVPRIEDIPRLEYDLFSSIYRGIRQGEKLCITGASEIVYGFAMALSEAGDSTLPLLVERPGEEKRFCHASNVCLFTLAQAQSLGIKGQLLHDIGLAALLHDIGNFFTLDELLGKAQPIDTAQRELIRNHPERGARLLMGIPGIPRLAVIVAYEHHLNYDLCGYPQVQAGWKQNICSHMVAIADTYDALYARMGSNPDPARVTADLLGMAGTRLEPVLTCNFVQMLLQNGLRDLKNRSDSNGSAIMA